MPRLSFLHSDQNVTSSVRIRDDTCLCWFKQAFAWFGFHVGFHVGFHALPLENTVFDSRVCYLSQPVLRRDSQRAVLPALASEEELQARFKRFKRERARAQRVVLNCPGLDIAHRRLVQSERRYGAEPRLPGYFFKAHDLSHLIFHSFRYKGPIYTGLYIGYNMQDAKV